MTIQQQEHDTLLSAVEQTPLNKIKKVSIPVSLYLHEVKQLMLWCTKDKTQLQKCGLTTTLFEEIEFLLNKAEEAQLKWDDVKNTKPEEIKIWNKKKVEAKELHTILMRHFRYAFRNNDKLRNKLVTMSKSPNAYPVLIQELADLAYMGESNIDLLKTINFEFSLLDQARSDNKTLSELLALKNTSSQHSASIKTERDKMLSALKIRVDEVRQAGKFIFINKPERLKGYTSAYVKRKNDKYQAKIKNNH